MDSTEKPHTEKYQDIKNYCNYEYHLYCHIMYSLGLKKT